MLSYCFYIAFNLLLWLKYIHLNENNEAWAWTFKHMSHTTTSTSKRWYSPWKNTQTKASELDSDTQQRNYKNTEKKVSTAQRSKGRDAHEPQKIQHTANHEQKKGAEVQMIHSDFMHVLWWFILWCLRLLRLGMWWDWPAPVWLQLKCCFNVHKVSVQSWF